MNSLIVYPLIIMFVVAMGSQIYSASLTTFAYNGTLTTGQNGSQTLDEVTYDLSPEQTDAVFDINLSSGFLALVIGLVAVGILAGIKVLGSGLSNFSVALIYKSTTYYGIWGVFSALSYAVFASFPYNFGILFWFGLTLIYSLGFFQTLGSGGSSG